MAGNQTVGRRRVALVEVEAVPDGDHDSQQQERERNAQHGQDAAPLVAKGTLANKTSQGHGLELRRALQRKIKLQPHTIGTSSIKQLATAGQSRRRLSDGTAPLGWLPNSVSH